MIKHKLEKPLSLEFWRRNGVGEDKLIMESLKTYRNVIKETFLMAMQLKLVHNIVATNKKKYDWKIIESPKCRYCLEVDTVIHFFGNVTIHKT